MKEWTVIYSIKRSGFMCVVILKIGKGVRGGKEIDIHGRCVVVRNVLS